MLWSLLPHVPRLSCAMRRVHIRIRQRRKEYPKGTVPDQGLLYHEGAYNLRRLP